MSDRDKNETKLEEELEVMNKYSIFYIFLSLIALININNQCVSAHGSLVFCKNEAIPIIVKFPEGTEKSLVDPLQLLLSEITN